MASTFTGDIRYGAKGDTVKQVQEALNKNGYNLAVDGIWGDKTDAAVKAYQKANGLTVDGIVGKNTWGSLFGSGDSNPGFTYDDFKYDDYSESDAVNTALTNKNNAESALANYGDFDFSKQNDWNSIYEQYKNRGDFSYDFNADALYQQYKDKYIKQGKMAMADTIGQASAMTGGYGNSYAATAGNQAYQASLENLNDVIPELYQLAYDKYNQKGQDMLNMLGLLNSERDYEYGVWGDKYNQLASDRDYYGKQYDTERTWDYGQYSDNRDFAFDKYSDDKGYAYQNYRDAIADEQWQKNFDLSERELAMAEEQWKLQKGAYSSGGSSSGSSSGGSTSGSKAPSGRDSVGGGQKSAYVEETVKPQSTKNTTAFINRMQTKSEYLARGRSEKEYYSYVESNIASLLGGGKITEAEALYMIEYFGLS